MRSKDEIVNSGIYTNDDYSLYERFKDILAQAKGQDTCLSSLVGYFRSSGYFPLAQSLKGLKKIRLLVGINADALSAGWYKKAREKRQALVREAAYREICEGIDEAGYRSEVSAGLKLFTDDVLSGRLEIRAVADRVVHAKFYVFAPELWKPGTLGVVTLITGSSNFTAPGLGIAEEEGRRNYELNMETQAPQPIGFALSEFSRLWEESVELIPTELAGEVRRRTEASRAMKPSDFYYRFLYEVFKDTVDYEGTGIEAYFPSGYKRLSYQIDAVNEGLGMLERHNGFFLADVVGLGKTIVATILLQRWFAGKPKEARALVVVPPVLAKNWEGSFTAFQLSRKKYTIISSGSLHKLKDPESYAIVIVDEAHNFRNSRTESYNLLNDICKKGGELGKKNVILVSATPVNNKPLEILNLLNLFQDTRASSLGVSDLYAFFQDKQRRYDEAKKEGVDPGEARRAVKEIYEEIRTLVLQDVTIRRTRSDLHENLLYQKDLDDQGVHFPKVQDPRSVPYYLDSDVDELFDDTLRALGQGLHYAYHKELSYLRGPAREKFSVSDNTFIQLSGLLRRFFMKRLDSSFSAFTESLRRFERDNASLLEMYRKGTVYYSNSVPVAEFIGNEDLEGLLQELEENRGKDPSISALKPGDFDPSFEADLVADGELLSSLLSRWEGVRDDPKFDMFASQLDGWLKVSVNPGRRLVVFSESEETVLMLRDRLAALGRTDVLAISAANRDEEEIAIRRNFDANYEASLREDRYRVLLATDVLAEGVNLHRANTVVNYDTPWNSVRLFQRVGRVNRVGSVADMVFIYNFFPLAKVDSQIELKKKAEMKLQAFHSAFGEDAAIYSPNEEVGHYGLYGGAGLEDEGPSPKVRLLLELRALMQENPERFARIAALPVGLRCLRSAPSRTGDKEGVAPASLVYLGTTRKDLFYLRSASGLAPIGLIEAAAVLRAEEAEQALDGETDWQALVEEANGAYEEGEREKAEEATRVRSYSLPEQQAILCLEAFGNGLDEMLGLTEEEAALFGKAVALIKAGAASKRLVAAIKDSKKNASLVSPEALARHLVGLLREYGVERQEVAAPRQPRELHDAIEPARCIMIEAWKEKEKI